MLLNCGVGEDSWESPGLQGDQTSQSEKKSVLNTVMLKLKCQYFGHLMQRTDSLEKTLMLGKIEGRSRRGWQKMRWLDGITDSMDMSLSGQGSLAYCSPRVGHKSWSQRVGHDWTTELNWTGDSNVWPVSRTTDTVHAFHLFNKPWLGAAMNQPLCVGAGVTTIRTHTVMPSWSQPSSGSTEVYTGN